MQVKTVKIKEGFQLRELGGEFVIAKQNDKNGSVDGLPSINETGVLLWHKLSLGATPNDLIHFVSEEKDVDLDEAEQDVGEFLAKLINGKIVDCEY